MAKVFVNTNGTGRVVLRIELELAPEEASNIADILLGKMLKAREELGLGKASEGKEENQRGGL